MYLGKNYYPIRYFGEGYFKPDIVESYDYFPNRYFAVGYFGTAYYGPSEYELEPPVEPPVVVTGRRSRRVGWFERHKPPLPRIVLEATVREDGEDTCSGTIRVGRVEPVLNTTVPLPSKVNWPTLQPLEMLRRSSSVRASVQEKGCDGVESSVRVFSEVTARAQEVGLDKCEGSARVSWDSEDEALVKEFITALQTPPSSKVAA